MVGKQQPATPQLAREAWCEPHKPCSTHYNPKMEVKSKHCGSDTQEQVSMAQTLCVVFGNGKANYCQRLYLLNASQLALSTTSESITFPSHPRQEKMSTPPHETEASLGEN